MLRPGPRSGPAVAGVGVGAGPAPPPVREVRSCWRAISQSTRRASGIVTSRKRIAPRVSAELLKVSDWMSRPTWTTSTKPITLTSEVSFIRAMKSFSSGGITLRTACGTITWRIAWR